MPHILKTWFKFWFSNSANGLMSDFNFFVLARTTFSFSPHIFLNLQISLKFTITLPKIKKNI